MTKLVCSDLGIPRICCARVHKGALNTRDSVSPLVVAQRIHIRNPAEVVDAREQHRNCSIHTCFIRSVVITELR